MSGSYIATTTEDDVQWLMAAGQSLGLTVAQLRHHLAQHLSPAHGALLAEPVEDTAGRATDWYGSGEADGEGAAPPLDLLPPGPRAVMTNRVWALLRDIRAEGVRLAASADSDQRVLGAMLEKVAHVPDLSCVRVRGGAPLLIAWAHGRAGQSVDLSQVFKPVDVPEDAVATTRSGGSAPGWLLPLLIVASVALAIGLVVWFQRQPNETGSTASAPPPVVVATPVPSTTTAQTAPSTTTAPFRQDTTTTAAAQAPPPTASTDAIPPATSSSSTSIDQSNTAPDTTAGAKPPATSSSSTSTEQSNTAPDAAATAKPPAASSSSTSVDQSNTAPDATAKPPAASSSSASIDQSNAAPEAPADAKPPTSGSSHERADQAETTPQAAPPSHAPDPAASNHASENTPPPTPSASPAHLPPHESEASTSLRPFTSAAVHKHDLALLQGCWSMNGDFASADIQTHTPAKVAQWRTCFAASPHAAAALTGTQSLAWQDGKSCSGPVTARFLADDKLEIADTADCLGDRTLLRMTEQCARKDDATMTCAWTAHDLHGDGLTLTPAR